MSKKRKHVPGRKVPVAVKAVAGVVGLTALGAAVVFWFFPTQRDQLLGFSRAQLEKFRGYIPGEVHKQSN